MHAPTTRRAGSCRCVPACCTRPRRAPRYGHRAHTRPAWPACSASPSQTIHRPDVPATHENLFGCFHGKPPFAHQRGQGRIVQKMLMKWLIERVGAGYSSSVRLRIALGKPAIRPPPARCSQAHAQNGPGAERACREPYRSAKRACASRNAQEPGRMDKYGISNGCEATQAGWKRSGQGEAWIAARQLSMNSGSTPRLSGNHGFLPVK